jgi:hypothetical protein
MKAGEHHQMMAVAGVWFIAQPADFSREAAF